MYGDCKTLKESLEYDISLERVKNYKEMNVVEVINNIADFSSRIWQTHPFREGNGRSTRIWLDHSYYYEGYITFKAEDL